MTLPIVLADLARLPDHTALRLLVAACALEGEHRTWAVDGQRRPNLEDLCARLGAGYRSDADPEAAAQLSAELSSAATVLTVAGSSMPAPNLLETRCAPAASTGGTAR